MSARAAALAYVRRGWSPLPIPFRGKKPIIEEWQHLRIGEADIPRFFNGAAQNVGVLLGEASAGLTDVDLDCPEALAVAPYILPPTKAVFGRRSSPASHWLYTVTEPSDVAVLPYKDPEARTDAMIVEMRRGGGRGAQTVFPPSTHADGEAIEWAEAGEPAKADAADLLRRVRLVAAASLIARCWPGEGGRHDAAMRLGAFLKRCAAVLGHEARPFVEAVARAAGDPEWRDRVRAAADADRYGYRAMRELLGDVRARKAAEWLGFTGSARASKAARTQTSARSPAAARSRS